MPYADYVPDIGPITFTCEECGQTVTYVKTNGPRRRFCSRDCAATAASLRHKEKLAARVRTCGCGSTAVPKTGKAICKGCRKHDRDRTDYNRTRRLANHGLTHDDFDEIFSAQGGLCAICRTDDPGERQWMIDHDHDCCKGIYSCGKCVRGIVCYYCNFLLGNARNNPNILIAAAEFLQVNTMHRVMLKAVK